MIDQLKAERFANSIMQNSSFRGSFLLVEGQSDFYLFKKFINAELCQIKIALGAGNVIEVIEILNQRRFKRCLGIIDSDFRRIDDNWIIKRNLILTDCHDIELDMINSPAFDTVIGMHCHEDKYSEFEKENGKDFKEVIFDLAKPLGYLRWTNHRHNLGLAFKPKNVDGKTLKYNDFIPFKSLKFGGIEKMIETIINYSRDRDKAKSFDKNQILKLYEIEAKKTFEAYQICNGHDITNVISLALRRAIGNENALNCSYKIIEKELILAFDSAHLKKTNLYRSIKEWEKDNVPLLAY